MQIAIRGLRKKDKGQVKKLVKEVYAEIPEAFTFPHAPTDKELENVFAEKIKRSREKTLIDIVAIKNKKVIGECEIAINKGQALVGIIVKKEERRKGVGSMLLNKAIEEAKELGVRELFAEVSRNNEPARKFFSLNGFKNKHKNKNFVFARPI